ncbi:MAG: ribokinase [Candidatus Humimicrobiaceae bacterium]
MLNNLGRGNILCSGAINMDLVLKVYNLPKKGETIIAETFETHPGGKGGNQAVAAALLGGNVSFLGKIGNDSYGSELYNLMQEKGINVKSIYKVNNFATGIAVIAIDHNGQNNIIYNPGANLNLSISDVSINDNLFDDNNIILITMELNTNVVYEIIKKAKKKNMFVILDPSPVPKESIPSEIMNLIDIIKPNEVEAFFLTGIEISNTKSAFESLKILKKNGVKYPIITLGEKGSVAYIDKEIIEIPTIRNLKTIDTTAAGDVFLGALAASISRNFDLFTALEFANKAAALSTTIIGAQTSIPTLEKVNNLKI